MATEYTPNYNLDLYTSTDKPNLRDQYNAAMGKIDTQLKANADGVTNVSSSVVAAVTTANEAKTTAEQAQTAANAAAPLNHATPNGVQIGVGTTNVYGHVELTDQPSSTAAVANGVAATPLCVDNKIEKIKNNTVLFAQDVDLSEIQSGKVCSVKVIGNKATGIVMVGVSFPSFINTTIPTAVDKLLCTIPASSGFSGLVTATRQIAGVGLYLSARAGNTPGTVSIWLHAQGSTISMAGGMGASLVYFTGTNID
nr:MAG TPA: hypothetical protein [Caudoviricetes sp.]